MQTTSTSLPVTHEVVEGPNGEQVTLEYRTPEERAAQIAAYLAADDSDATVERSDEESDEEESDDGNTDAQRDRMVHAAMDQLC